MHLHLQFCERDDSDGYHYCLACGAKTILVSAPMSWSVDGEPYKADEQIELDFEDVELSEEVTGHWCEQCNKLTSLAFNSRD